MFSYGDIVIVNDLLDSNGVNPKTRPYVVIAPDQGVLAGDPIYVVAISTMLPGPVPPDVIVMQYHPRGHQRTGLKKRCAAFARWLAEVDPARVDRKIGHVPPRDLTALAEMLDRMFPTNEEPTGG